MNRSPILGTRGSPLALVQAHKVASALEVANRWPADFVQIQTVQTTGDQVQDRPLAEIGGKQLWTKELDRALMEEEVDFCVHSLKDVEAIRPREINIAAVRPRGDVQDRLIGAEFDRRICRKGRLSARPRRVARRSSCRSGPDLKIVPLRGNVQTRLAKLEAGEVQATLLAGAGLRRLGMANVGTPIPLEVMLPAPTQAVIAIECRADDAVTQSVLTIIDDQTTHALIRAERAFVAALGGSCHSPVAVYGAIEGGKILLKAQILSEDGRDQLRDEAVFECGDHESPRALALAMLESGAGLDPLALQGGMRRLFVFRPEPAASRTVDKAKALGLDVVSIPLFSLERVDWSAPDPDRFDAILLTSANAVNLAGEQLQKMRAAPRACRRRSDRRGRPRRRPWRCDGRRGRGRRPPGCDRTECAAAPSLRRGPPHAQPRLRQAIDALTVYRAVTVDDCDLRDTARPGCRPSLTAGRAKTARAGRRSDAVHDPRRRNQRSDGGGRR